MSTQQVAKNNNSKEKVVLVNKLEKELFDRYGPMIGGAKLHKVLGYNTSAAFRLALKQGDISLPVFKIEKRRGNFALTVDIAAWLVEQKFKKEK